AWHALLATPSHPRDPPPRDLIPGPPAGPFGKTLRSRQLRDDAEGSQEGRSLGWRTVVGRPLWAAAVAVVVFGALLVTGIGGPHTTLVVDDVGTAVAAAVATVGCWWAWRRGTDRGAWALLGAACLAWTAGEVLWGFYELV